MTEKQTFHFIGIGGIGMSAVARCLKVKGFDVQGSDLKPTRILSELTAVGVRVMIGQRASNVDGATHVVYSSSIPPDHVERARAEKLGLTVMHRAEALAELCKGKFTIAVAGTHGKTTTTSMIGMILREAGRDPSIVVGGWVEAFGGNAVLGTGPEIVIEADESDSSFLRFTPDVEVITNIEEEHMDHFGDIGRVETAYREFIRRLPLTGEWFGSAEDAHIRKLVGERLRRCVLYGIDDAQATLSATNIEECPGGQRGIAFDAQAPERTLGRIRMKLMGRHNVLNALAAIGVALKLGIHEDAIARGLERYEGAGRRFDVKYEDREFLVVDDYAHHPTEIRRTLTAAKALKKKRIVALFQPHRYSRTEFLLEEFGKSFADADKLIVTDIYAASEKPRAGVSGAGVCSVVCDSGHRDATFVERTRMTEFVRGQLKPGDLVIALGAGDISEVAGELSDYLKSHVNLFSWVKGRVLRDEPLSKHTTLKVGGPVDFWIEPEDEEDLRRTLEICRRHALKVYLFGAGSNMLPPDEGLRGAAIALNSGYFRTIRRRGTRVTARAGVPNAFFIQYALEHGLGGCEFLAGIPGVIGGAVAMNAGSHGRWTDSILTGVRAIDAEGRQVELNKTDLSLSYRRADLRGTIVLEAVFELPLGSREASQAVIDEYHAHRARTQDLQRASAGCMFKNPKDVAVPSGKLIDDAGLKGLTVGRAQVSEKHANFIVNLGGATSADIRELIERVRAAVKLKYGVELETEVKIL